jgi:hypothetical protein
MTCPPTKILHLRPIPRLKNHDAHLLIRRIGICHRCTDRPAGCWRAVEYGCTQKYHAAGRQTAETGNCPLKKLDL